MAAPVQDTASHPIMGAKPKTALQHPISPLTAGEITESSKLVRQLWPEHAQLQFKAVTLQEPNKAELLPFLTAEHEGKPTTSIDRRSFVLYYIRNTDKLHEAIVNLTLGKVESNVRLGPNIHSNSDEEDIVEVEKLVLADESVKAEIAKLQLPAGTVVICDPWSYGTDGVSGGLFDDNKRYFQCFLYIRDPKNPSEADGNHYAMPLSISPVVSAETLKVTRIDFMPTGADNTIKEPSPYKVQPPNEYIPEAQTLRTDLKPLHVIQPEGASFSVSGLGEQGHILKWQKWEFKVGFNQREGMVLYDVHYDGRPLFYRISLSDMSIPYADPRHPFHKKAAFDLGDVGAGIMANNLKLGCDCLGSIHYLSAVLSNTEGLPIPMENVVCIHEQDSGIGFKHTNYRTSRAVVVRSRELVLQSIITVSNYEYILAFMFTQAGELAYEVRATGILSTQPIDEDVESVPWGTIVHPGVLAAHHQHIFSLRIDPMLDGPRNTLVYTEAHPMLIDDFNPHGVGYTATKTPVSTSSGHDLAPQFSRTFKIENSSVHNPINKQPVSYKIHATPFQTLLAHPTSFHHKRAEFADKSIYVTRYRDDELFAGGKYTNQSRGGTGVRTWASRNEPVLDEDIVVWVQFGMNHIPRIEDFPVMPVEILKVSLKPVNFFTKNPALDVPPSTQAVNKSVLLTTKEDDVKSKEAPSCCSSTTSNTLVVPAAKAEEKLAAAPVAVVGEEKRKKRWDCEVM